MRGYDTTTQRQTTGSTVRGAGTDACRSSGFIGGGQTFKFSFDAPPRKPLLWACLLARASRDLYPVRLWFARALIPHPICSGRDTGLSRRKNRNLAVISQSEHFFGVCPPPPPPSLFTPFILFLYTPLLSLHIFRYNYGGSLSLQMCLLVARLIFQIWGDELKCDVAPTEGTYALILDCSHSVNETCSSLINYKWIVNNKWKRQQSQRMCAGSNKLWQQLQRNVNSVYFLWQLLNYKGSSKHRAAAVAAGASTVRCRWSHPTVPSTTHTNTVMNVFLIIRH